MDGWNPDRPRDGGMLPLGMRRRDELISFDNLCFHGFDDVFDA